MKDNIINAVLKEKLVVIVRGVKKDKLIPLAEAMKNGGIRLLEITYDSSKTVSDEETAENIKMLKDHFGDEMYIGAGTVTTVRQVELTKSAGGEFIISPDTNGAVIEKTVELDMVSMPGALTPTEIKIAQRYGADFVKLFPCESMGPSYIKAVKAPLSDLPLLAVGGINPDNMLDYLDAGVCGFGVGTNIVNKALLEKSDFDGITKLAERYVAVLHGRQI